MLKPVRIRNAMLSLTLLTSFGLAACSNNGNQAADSSPKAPASGSSASAAAATTTEEEVTLRFYFGGDKKSATDEVWKAVSDYVKSKGLNVNFVINTIPFGDPYAEKLLVMSSSGDDWDLNFDGDWLAYRQMSAKGAYMTLNDLLPKYAPNLYKVYQEQGTLAAATVNGNIVALPWTMKMNQRPYVKWRSDVATAANIQPADNSIQTVEDMYDFAHKLQEAAPDQKIGFPAGSALMEIFRTRDELLDLSPMGANQFVIDLNDSTYQVKPIEQLQTYRDLAVYAGKLYKEGIINKDVLVDKEDAATKYRNGKILFANSSHEWTYATETFSDPTFTSSGSLLYPDKKHVNRTALANVAAINANSKHADRVLRFLDMLETDQTLYDLVQYGIEGKTYVLEDGMAKYPDGMDSTTSNYMEWGGQWAFWKPQFMRPTETYGQDFWVKEAEFASEPNNINNPLDGFTFNTESIKNELVQRDQVHSELGVQIEAGIPKNPEASVDEYIAKQQKAGVDKVVAELQKQVDAFVASKK
ncbi:DUF3502 domain-containing protein [Cohnella sp. AR92]|uniref:DUF3502 domain-containing protein n=1 Tax=Cohnella sp. AR92 TaxID=648716 RepID=UPI001EDC95F6|nr:DUF3502 domain-containing protein [Cohnella sp. AR92]